MSFPSDFIWGVATASYQIEGAVEGYGRGECIWHRFSHTPGKVANMDNGDVACDHYHRYPDDIRLMQSLGIRAYRFSISWPRVMPLGSGATNAAGLDFYDRLTDTIIEAGITPYVTLYHWDLPQALQDQGGWANDESVKWFTDYTDLMTRRLGDRIKSWITINEPWVVAFLGNWHGIHAPGIRDLPTAYRVAHNLLLAHGAAMPIIRQNVPDVQAGITLDLLDTYPASDSPGDQAAAYREDGFKNRWFLDAVFHGRYPQDIVSLMGETLDGIDLEAVSQAAVPMDFLGINYYTRGIFADSQNGPLLSESRSANYAADHYTAMGWEIYPNGLERLLVRLHKEYQPPALFVTENGAAFDDPVPVDGVVDDANRVAYLKSHFEAAERAIVQGAPLRGYFVWSLLDNFEWAEGYEKRFGIVHVDYRTLVRTPKASARFYRDMMQRERV